MGVFYMFLSELNYASLCTFLLQLSRGPHSHFFLLADYLLRHICDCICNFSHLQIISCAIFVTAFAIFLTCRLSPAPYLWLHSQFFPFVDYPCAILVTAFALFFICRLSPLYTCDHIRNFSHLQIISALYLWLHSHFFSFADYLLRHICDCISSYPSLQIIFPAIFVTAFVIFPICRLSLRYTCDRIRNFSHL